MRRSATEEEDGRHDRDDRIADFREHAAALITTLKDLLQAHPRRADAVFPYSVPPRRSPDFSVPPIRAFTRQLAVHRSSGRHSPTGFSPPAFPPAAFPEGRAEMVRRRIRQRRCRAEYFATGLFADPAWDMLLDLYAAHYEGTDVSVSSLCIAAGVPPTTALRTIRTMTDEGWLVRRNDPYDKRRIFLSLSDEALRQLDAYFDDIER